MAQKRIVYLDYFRVLCMFCVVIGHLATSQWHTTDVASFDWQVFNVYAAFTRFCVPGFMMISGALMLSHTKEVSCGHIYRKILRFVVVLLFWSAVYLACKALFNSIKTGTSGFASWQSVFVQLIQGHFHLWFLYTIIGLYIGVPVFRKITESKRLEKYFIIIAFVFGFLIKSILLYPAANEVFAPILSDLRNSIGVGYSGYFVLGHYLHHYDLQPKTYYLLGILGIVGLGITLAGTSMLSLRTGTLYEYLQYYLQANIFLISAFVFASVKRFQYLLPQGAEVPKNCLMARLSNLTLGVYLIHMLVIYALRAVGLTSTFIASVIAIPLLAIVVFLLSLGATFILKKIPLVGRYLV